MPEPEIELVKRLYEHFNARDIDGVLALLASDVVWANAMDGGHVHGHDGVRAYWTRQWAVVSPHVEPVGFRHTADDTVTVEVAQTIRDLQGRPLTGQSHGLKDKAVMHSFRFRNGQVIRFDVGDAS